MAERGRRVVVIGGTARGVLAMLAVHAAALAALGACETGGTSDSGGTTGGTPGAGGTSATGGTGGTSGSSGASGTGTGGAGMDATGGTGTGGASGAGSGGTGGASGSSGTGGMGATGGTGVAGAGSGDCPAGLEGPALVNVPAPAGSTVSSYCMDATEVTNAHYAAFVAASVPTSEQDAWCSFNTTYTPSSGWPATGKDDYPVVYVDWCDAYAYCKWAGKRLCGKIGGGANADADYDDASKSEWYNACTAGGSMIYPYGDTYSGTVCVGSDYDGTEDYQSGSDVARPVGTATCEGSYEGLYDLSGNVWEWEDSCDGTTGNSDSCRLRGGGFVTNGVALGCRYASGKDSRDSGHDVDYYGFRCCSASP